MCIYNINTYIYIERERERERERCVPSVQHIYIYIYMYIYISIYRKCVFIYIYIATLAPSGVPSASHLLSYGVPLVPFAYLLRALLAPMGCPLGHLGCLGASSRIPWKLEYPMCQIHYNNIQYITCLHITRRSRRNGVMKSVRIPSSTGPGGQAYVCFTKTFKLRIRSSLTVDHCCLLQFLSIQLSNRECRLRRNKNPWFRPHPFLVN